MWYLYIISVGMGVSYLLLYFLFPLLFTNKLISLKLKSLYSIIYVVVFSLTVNFISNSIADQWFGDRILHIFGGGVTAFLVCFLVVRDSKLKINKFQFLVISLLTVTSLGVVNELIEFFLQMLTHIIFAPTITDTWLDLLSNTIGAIIGAACFAPFINNRPKIK